MQHDLDTQLHNKLRRMGVILYHVSYRQKGKKKSTVVFTTSDKFSQMEAYYREIEYRNSFFPSREREVWMWEEYV